MPEHPLLRIRTPPSTEEMEISDKENTDKENHKNIMIMLIIVGILHLLIYCVNKDELFFWISILFMVISLITASFVKKKRPIYIAPKIDSMV